MGCIMFYIYRSKVGTFSIELDNTDAGTVKLCVGGFWLGSYKTAQDAARSVRLRVTGWYDWDRLKDFDAPCDLSEWEKL